MNKTIIALTVSAAVMSISQAALADEGKLTAGTGFNYSSGDYGTSTTTKIRSVPFDLGYETGAWTFKLSVPYVDISGPSNVIPGVGRVKNSNLNLRGGGVSVGLGGSGTSSSQTSGTARGMGDVVASASYNLYNNAAAQFGVDLAGKIKFGTADKDKGLGTGENDYGAEVDIYKTLDSVTLFGGVGYTKMGTSQYIQLKNVFNATAGASLKLSEVSSVGVAFDYRERASDTSFPRREATAFYSYRYAKAWKTQVYVLKGFSDGSPNWGAGASIAYSF